MSSHRQYVEDLVADTDSLHSESRTLIYGYFFEQPDRGVAAALECALDGTDRTVVSYGAEYLSFLPGHRAEKTRVGERLRTEAKLLPAVSALLPWLPRELVRGYVEDYLEARSAGREWPSLVYDVGVEWPGVLREYSSRFAGDATVELAVLAGAPDSLADEHFENWRATGEETWLLSLAAMRTERAAGHLATARAELADPEPWDTELEFAGRLPGGNAPAGPWPAYRGFVLALGESPHSVGGTAPEVPVCEECELPGAVLLRLAAADLPYGFERDPAFYWYGCDCDEEDSLTTKERESGLEAYGVPLGPPEDDVELAPGPRSLVLEQLGHRHGVSLDGLPGFAAHQVGGLPNWLEKRAHPRCPECESAMPHAATVDSGRTPFGDMRFEGVLYCFWCDPCGVGTTVHQT